MRYNVYTNLKGDIPMNIFYQYRKTVEFSELKVGDTFLCCGKPCLKLADTYTSDGWRRNAFDFDTCEMTVYDSSTIVMPVRADLTVRI